jgi:hypothetical protein
MFRTSLCSVLVLLFWSAVAHSQSSPYVGQKLREIKALSPQEISDYLSGKGMGLAKAAELNGYPGPAHVLELATELKLTPDQKARTEALFKNMEARAITLGKELVEEERVLDSLFASRSVTPEVLAGSLARIARFQGELRQVHLQAHLEQTALLTPDQVRQYNRLRGYGAAPENEKHERKHH